MKVSKIERIFKYGTLTLTDPAPHLPPPDAIRLYEDQYPELANSSFDGPVYEGGKQVFTVSRSVGTKG